MAPLLASSQVAVITPGPSSTSTASPVGRIGCRIAEPRNERRPRNLDQAGDDAHGDAGQHVAAHARIAEMSREEARPAEQAVRPPSPDVRLERDVDDPDQRGRERDVRRRAEQVRIFRLDGRRMMSEKQPCKEPYDRDERREAVRAMPSPRGSRACCAARAARRRRT